MKFYTAMIERVYSPVIYALLLYSLSVSPNQPVLTAQCTIDGIASAYQNVYGFSGTVTVMVSDSTLFEKSYGLASREFNVANTPTTRNSINSISKTFTALGIMILADEGTISLSDPIGAHLDYLSAEWKDSITLHHLLSHTSGLPRESGVQRHDELTLKEQTALVAGQDLQFRPGTQYEYSNCGYILLGAVIEEVSGEEYADFIETRIVDPLELENTGVYRGRSVVMNQATPYRFTTDGVISEQRTKHFGENAGGGIYSTTSDLYKYVRAIEGNVLLADTLADALFAPHIESGSGEYEGYAWSIKVFGEDTIRFAAGSGYGTKSVIIRNPDTGLFIGITSNWGNTPILNLLRDIYLCQKGQAVKLPDAAGLAKPADYQDKIGLYEFDRDQLKAQLGIDRSVLKLHAFEGKLFLDDELLAINSDGSLGLTYTDEMRIEFNKALMLIEINGNSIVGNRL